MEKEEEEEIPRDKFYPERGNERWFDFSFYLFFLFFFVRNNDIYLKYAWTVCLSMKVIITRFPLQVSRSTGILSHFVNLNIVIPEAFILGSGEHHVDVGSIINLVCIIEKVRISFFFFFSFNPTFHSFRRNKNSILQRLDEWLMQSYSIFFPPVVPSPSRTYHNVPPSFPFFLPRLRNCNHETAARYWKYVRASGISSC